MASGHRSRAHPSPWQRFVPVPRPRSDKVGQALAPGSRSASRWKDALEGSGHGAQGLRGVRSWRWGCRGSMFFGVCRIPFIPGVLDAFLPCHGIPAGRSPPGCLFLGPSLPSGAAPPPRFALKRSEPEQLRLLPGSARSALPAFPLAAGGKLRSGFPSWVYPAQPGFGRKPREGFWRRTELRALARAGIGVQGSRTGEMGSTGLGRAARGT